MNRMNRMNVITLLASIVSLILMSCLTMIDGIFDTLKFVIAIVIALTAIALYKKNSIKKFKVLYNLILMILIIFSGVFIILFGYNIISCFIDISCSNNLESNLELTLLTILFTFICFQIVDIKIENSKINHILTWIASFIVLIIYARYYYDGDLLHNYIYQNQYDIQNSYIFVTQNYPYLNILYVSLFIHYLINKKQV